MTKKATKKPAKRPSGIAKLAPVRPAAIAPAAAPTPAAPVQSDREGPRGGKPAKRPDRAVPLTVKVSRAQYRQLMEARLDANATAQEFLLRAVAYYFEKELGTKF